MTMRRLKKLCSYQATQLYIHLFNYIIFEENDEINEFKRTFNSNWMSPVEHCFFRRRLYYKYPTIIENQLIQNSFFITKLIIV